MPQRKPRHRRTPRVSSAIWEAGLGSALVQGTPGTRKVGLRRQVGDGPLTSYGTFYSPRRSRVLYPCIPTDGRRSGTGHSGDSTLDSTNERSQSRQVWRWNRLRQEVTPCRKDSLRKGGPFTSRGGWRVQGAILPLRSILSLGAILPLGVMPPWTETEVSSHTSGGQSQSTPTELPLVPGPCIRSRNKEFRDLHLQVLLPWLTERRDPNVRCGRVTQECTPKETRVCGGHREGGEYPCGRDSPVPGGTAGVDWNQWRYSRQRLCRCDLAPEVVYLNSRVLS